VLDAESIGEYYEKILLKSAFTGKPGRRAWTEDENLVLVSIVTYLCKAEERDFSTVTDANWDYIATFIPGRKADHLKLQWLSFLKTKLTQAPWTPYEDELLKQIMKEKGRGNHWKEIAVELNARCNSQVYRHGKQCRERWINHLDPAISRGPWTDEEDLRMLRSFQSVGGKKWADISKMMKDRTENSVKNRWNSLYKKFIHELGYESQSLNSLDSESDNQNERDRRVTQRIIDVITKNMGSNGGNTPSMLDKKQEIPDISMSIERRFQELNVFPEPTFEKRRRAYSSELPNTENRILNKMSLLKELISEDTTAASQYRSMAANMMDDYSGLRQNLGGMSGNTNTKLNLREIPPYSMQQKNSAGNTPSNQHQQNSPLFSQNFPSFSFENMGLSKMEDNKAFSNIANKSGVSHKTGDDFMRPAPLYSKNNGHAARQLGYSLGIIKENSLEDPHESMLMNIQDSVDLSLREKSFKEFHDNANRVVGNNNLQFAVVDLTKGELYFVNSLNHRNLQKSLSAMQTSESDAHLYPTSPLFNFSGPQAPSSVLNTGNDGKLHQHFANMKISSGKKRFDQPRNAKDPMADLQKEAAKSYLDRLTVGNTEHMDNLLSGHGNPYAGSHLFPNF
jgi:hypothetical protein